MYFSLYNHFISSSAHFLSTLRLSSSAAAAAAVLIALITIWRRRWRRRRRSGSGRWRGVLPRRWCVETMWLWWLPTIENDTAAHHHHSVLAKESRAKPLRHRMTRDVSFSIFAVNLLLLLLLLLSLLLLFASLPLFDRSDLRSYHLLLSTTSLVALAVRITSHSKEEKEIYRNNDEWRQKAYKPANNNCLSLSVIRKVPRLPEKQLLLVLFAYYYYYNTDLYSSD